MNVSPCKSCRRPVTWVTTLASGKPMPLDHDTDNGNVVLDERGRAVVFRNHAAALAAMDELETIPEGATYISHHAAGQCPKGRSWKDRPRAQGSLEV